MHDIASLETRLFPSTLPNNAVICAADDERRDRLWPPSGSVSLIEIASGPCDGKRVVGHASEQLPAQVERLCGEAPFGGGYGDIAHRCRGSLVLVDRCGGIHGRQRMAAGHLDEAPPPTRIGCRTNEGETDDMLLHLRGRQELRATWRIPDLDRIGQRPCP